MRTFALPRSGAIGPLCLFIIAGLALGHSGVARAGDARPHASAATPQRLNPLHVEHTLAQLFGAPAQREPRAPRARNTAWADSGDAVRALRSIDQRLFYLKAESAYDTPRLVMRAGVDGPERVLLDPLNLRGERGVHTIDFFTPSPDGRWVALGLSRNGMQGSVLRVLQVATGKFGAERITRTRLNEGVAWLPDSQRFLYNRLADDTPDAAVATATSATSATSASITATTPVQLQRASSARLSRPATPRSGRSAVWLHRVGQGASSDTAVFGAGVSTRWAFTATDLPRVTRTTDSRWLLAEVVHGKASARSYYAVRATDLQGADTPWERVIAPSDRIGTAVQAGAAIYGLARQKGSHQDLMRWDLSDATASHRVPLPPGGTTPRRLIAGADSVFIEGLDGNVSRLLQLSASTAKSKPLPLPIEGVVRDVVPRGQGVLVRMDGPEQPAAWWSVELGKPTRAIGLEKPAGVNTSGPEAGGLGAS